MTYLPFLTNEINVTFLEIFKHFVIAFVSAVFLV